jgi:hypothetical protein
MTIALDLNNLISKFNEEKNSHSTQIFLRNYEWKKNSNFYTHKDYPNQNIFIIKEGIKQGDLVISHTKVFEYLKGLHKD